MLLQLLLLTGLLALADTATVAAASETNAVEFTGTLEVVQVCYDRPPWSERWYRLIEDQTGAFYTLKFAAEPAEGHRTGERVRVRGHRRGDEISVPGKARGKGNDMEVLAAAPVSTVGVTQTIGPQSIYDGGTTGSTTVRSALVMLLNFTNKTEFTPAKITTISNSFFASTGASVNTAYLENTYGAIGFAGDVIICNIQADANDCPNNGTGWFPLADAQALAQGYNPANYAHKVYFVPCCPCGWSGLAAFGGNWVQLAYRDGGTYTHELGHNLGMAHASTQWNNTNQWVEYGDLSDFMASTYDWRHNNGPHKVQMGWVTPQTVTQPGVYQISRIEDDPATVPYPQVLKFNSSSAPNGWPYYLSYKQAVGFDANLPAKYKTGLSIHRWQSLQTAAIAVLSDGGTFTDPATGWIIKQLRHDTNSVTIGMGKCTGFVAQPITAVLTGDQLAAQTPVALPIPNSACDPFTVTNYDATSVQGGTITLAGSQFVYTPPGVFFGNDTFTYSGTDVFGVPSSATVSLFAVPYPHYDWDANGTAAGQGGTGTWDTTSFRWNNGTNVWPSTGTSNWAFFGGTAGTVSIASGGVAANGLLFSTNGYLIQNNTLTFNGSQPTVYVSPGMTARINSAVAGGAGLTKEGDGTLILAGNNTITGGMALNAGTLTLGSANALGTSPLTINGGALDSTVAGLVNANNNAQNWNGDFAFVGTQDLDLGTGAVTPNASRRVTVSAGNLTVGGPIGGGAVSLTKAGSGTLTLGGANTYSGATTVSGGTLTVNGSLAAASSVTVSNGATLGGTGTLGGAVTNYGNLSPGASSMGTLTVGGALTLNSGSTSTFEVDGAAPASDRIVLGGAVTYGGTLNIVASGTFTEGQTFTLFSGAGATNTGKFASLTGTPGVGLAFAFTNGVLRVVASPAGNPFAWFKLDEGAGNTVNSAVGGYTGKANAGGTGTLLWTNGSLAAVPLIPPASNGVGTVAALNVQTTNSAVTTTCTAATGNAARSYSAWIKCGPQSASAPTIIGVNDAGSATSNRFDLMIDSSGKLRVEKNGGNQVGNTVITNNAWRHLAVTYSSGTVKLYVDGALDTTGASFGPLNIASSKVISIGDNPVKAVYGTGRLFVGQIDDVRIYNAVLAPEDVQLLALSPAITNAMASQTNSSGNATFNSGITAFGAGLTGLTWQWSLNGEDLDGETNSSYTIADAPFGIHTVAVRASNSYGTVTNTATFAVLAGNPVITATPSNFPVPVSTVYGTASSPASVAVAGSNLLADLTAVAPTGFEVSSDNATYSGAATFFQSGGSASGTLYLRLKNNAPVTGSYNSVNVVLSSPGATSTNVATTASGNTVSPKALNVVNVTALDKMYDGTTAGIVIGSLDTPEAFGEGNSADGRPYTGDALSLSTATGTFASPDVGTGIPVTAGTFTLSGAAAGNYTLTQPTGSLTAAIRDTAVWTNPLGGSWTNINNWQNGLVATGTHNNADFTTLSLTADRSVSLDGARTIGNLWFADQSTNNYGWTIPSGGGPLTLAVNSGTPVVSNSTFTTITVQLAGSQGFQKTGTGILRLNNTANPITGEILVSQGVLQIRDGSSTQPGSVFAATNMDQRSLRITGSGLMDLFRTAGAAATVTWSLPAITLENGGTLRFRNGDNFAYTYNLGAALALGSGGGVIASTGGTASQFVNLSGALSGSGALEYLANSGTTRRLTISNANNSFSGNWTVAHTGTGTAFLRAGAANALGSGTVTLNAGATLENNAANGLDSLAGVTLNETNSVLDLSANAWNNASATLTASNGTIKLGSWASEVGPFMVNSTGTVTLTGTGGSLLATDTEVQAGTLSLADGAQLRFRIGNNGVNNQLKGVGAVNLNGVFNLDVSGANTTVGNAWALVDVASLTESFGATFSVTSSAGAFTKTSPGVWKKQIDATKRYVFAEATGILGIEANNAPVAQDITLGVSQGGNGTLAILGGKHAPSDADGDTLTVSLPSATTANGAAVSTDGSSITVNYSGVPSFTGTDSFNYTVSDGFGGTVTKTITVAVSAGGTAPNIISVTGPAPNITVNFAGIPDSTYAIERATSASGPWTEIAASVRTGTNGLGSHTDSSAPETTAFYRTRFVSTP